MVPEVEFLAKDCMLNFVLCFLFVRYFSTDFNVEKVNPDIEFYKKKIMQKIIKNFTIGLSIVR